MGYKSAYNKVRLLRDHHFFTHIENGKYISVNGFGPIRIFESFQEMLKQDGFPKGFAIKDYKNRENVHEADIGQSVISTLMPN